MGANTAVSQIYKKPPAPLQMMFPNVLSISYLGPQPFYSQVFQFYFKVSKNNDYNQSCAQAAK